MQKRSHVAVFLGISLDGRIAGEGGDLKWLSECAAESTAETGYDALMARTDALVMGRNTYDAVVQMAEWPFAGKKVFVMTRRPLAARYGEQALQGDIGQALQEVAARGCSRIYLDGGDVVRQALRQDRVDELTLSWVPVVLGRGVSLFEDGMSLSRWRLGHSRPFPSGMVQASYTRRV